MYRVDEQRDAPELGCDTAVEIWMRADLGQRYQGVLYEAVPAALLDLIDRPDQASPDRDCRRP